mgnify:CR=1 FL=1
MEDMASKSISKSVMWQLGGKIALQGIAFFSTPIFTRLLSPSDYGFTALYGTWLAIFGLVVGLCVGASIGNAWITYGEEKLSSYLSSVMTIGVISYFVILALVLLLNGILVKAIGLSFPIILLLITHSFFSFVISFEVARLDQLKKVEKSTVLSTALSLSVILTSLLFVYLAKENKWQAKVFGQALPTSIFGAVLLFIIYIRGKRFWSKEYAKFCLKLCLPLIVHATGHLVFSQTDRIMLQKFYDETTLGIYSISFNLCGVLTIIYGAFNSAWVPFYYEFKKQGNDQEVISHSRRYLKIFTLLCVGFILLSYDVYKLMAPQSYWSGMDSIPFFVMSIYFGFLYLFPVNFEFFNAKTKLIPVATFFAAGINILINFLLIPNYGIVGAAIGTMVAHFVLFLFHAIVARFVIKKEFEYKWHIFVPGLCVITAFCIGTPLVKQYIIIRWVLAVLIGVYLVRDIYKTKRIF